MPATSSIGASVAAASLQTVAGSMVGPLYPPLGGTATPGAGSLALGSSAVSGPQREGEYSSQRYLTSQSMGGGATASSMTNSPPQPRRITGPQQPLGVGDRSHGTGLIMIKNLAHYHFWHICRRM